MSNPYPNQPRKLLRSRSNRFLGGVCGGLADYLNMDATIVRLLTVVLSAFTGVPVVLYLVALLVVPEEPVTPYEPSAPSVGRTGSVDDRPYASTPATDPVWGPGGAPWEQPQSVADPVRPEPVQPEPAQADPVRPAPVSSQTSPADPAAERGGDRDRGDRDRGDQTLR